MPRRKRAERRRGGRRYKRTGRRGGGAGTAGLGPANLYPYGVAAMV